MQFRETRDHRIGLLTGEVCNSYASLGELSCSKLILKVMRLDEDFWESVVTEATLLKRTSDGGFIIRWRYRVLR